MKQKFRVVNVAIKADGNVEIALAADEGGGPSLVTLMSPTFPPNLFSAVRIGDIIYIDVFVFGE